MTRIGGYTLNKSWKQFGCMGIGNELSWAQYTWQSSWVVQSFWKRKNGEKTKRRGDGWAGSWDGEEKKEEVMKLERTKNVQRKRLEHAVVLGSLGDSFEIIRQLVDFSRIDSVAMIRTGHRTDRSRRLRLKISILDRSGETLSYFETIKLF